MTASYQLIPFQTRKMSRQLEWRADTIERIKLLKRPVLMPLAFTMVVVAAITAGVVLSARMPSPATIMSPKSHASKNDRMLSSLVNHMSTSQKVGQLLMVSIQGTSWNPSIASMMKSIQPGGVILFGNNVSSTSQVKSLDGQLQHHSSVPLLISIDQEGGEVDRITSGIDVLPSEQSYGQKNDPKTLQSDTKTVGTELRQLGVNMNLAPVLDVATDPNSPIAQDMRSFGPNPSRDAKLGAAAIAGYQAGGVAATAKHVLGLGTTSTNAENQLPEVRLSGKALQAQLEPFGTAVKKGVDTVMVTHIILDGITSPGTPASMSYKVVTGIVRKKLGFKGVIMTDSLSMGAIVGHFGMARASRQAFLAGNDIDLVAETGQPLSVAKNALITGLKQNKISMKRLDASVTRILKLKQKLHLPLK